MSGPDRTEVLFVCHGNICRSPVAEGVFKHLVVERGLERSFRIDSAGTHALSGQLPHPLSMLVAQQHGISLASVSRGLVPDDLQRFEHLVVMDRFNSSNVDRLVALAAQGPHPAPRARVRLLRAIVDPTAQGENLDVPDPMGGTPEGFGEMFQLVLDGCRALLDELAPRA